MNQQAKPSVYRQPSTTDFKVLYCNTILLCYDNCHIQVFDLRQCYLEMQKQAAEACATVAAQKAAVRGE